MKQFQTLAEYQEAKQKHDANYNATKAYLDANKTNCIPCEISATFPFADEVNNDMRSAIEEYEFRTDAPKSYFLYISKEGKATTWTGQVLGNVSFSKEFRAVFGDIRQRVTVYGINGKIYHGTFYKSAGDYARIKLAKNQ